MDSFFGNALPPPESSDVFSLTRIAAALERIADAMEAHNAAAHAPAQPQPVMSVRRSLDGSARE